MRTGNGLMASAQVVAREPTAELPLVVAPAAAHDPLDVLVERERPTAAHAVDALQVAASLEASGVTDRVARVRFGFADVFELAEEVRRRITPEVDPRPKPRHQEPSAWRDIGHGAIYLMPAALFPAALTALGNRSALLLPIVITGAVGWVTSGVVSWLAYRLLGDGHPGSANRLLRWATLAALPLGAAVAGVVAAATGVGLAVMLLAAAAMAYQLAVTILVIRRREVLVFASIIPALVAGVAYLVAGRALLPLAIAIAGASVAFTLGQAVRETVHRGSQSTQIIASIRSHRAELAMVLAYTALSAIFFLYPQLPHLANRFEVILAVLPLIAGMGVVEWRAHRFSHQARALLARVDHPRRFARRIWLHVLNGLWICFAAVGALTAVLLSVLIATGRYSHDAMVMATACVLLAGAYFLGFLLANLQQYAWLCPNLLLGIATYTVARIVLPDPFGDTDAFRVAAAVLLVLNLVALTTVAGDARRHR